MLNDSANRKVCQQRSQLLRKRNKREVLHPKYSNLPLRLLQESAGDFICPGEMFGVNERPYETKHQRRNRDEISKAAHECQRWVQRGAISRDNAEALQFHAGSLTAA